MGRGPQRTSEEVRAFELELIRLLKNGVTLPIALARMPDLSESRLRVMRSDRPAFAKEMDRLDATPAHRDAARENLEETRFSPEIVDPHEVYFTIWSLSGSQVDALYVSGLTASGVKDLESSDAAFRAKCTETELLRLLEIKDALLKRALTSGPDAKFVLAHGLKDEFGKSAQSERSDRAEIPEDAENPVSAATVNGIREQIRAGVIGGPGRSVSTAIDPVTGKRRTIYDEDDSPPISFSPTERTTEYLEARLGVDFIIPNGARIKSTDLGILFLFPKVDYWQERRWIEHRDIHAKWKCPDSRVLPTEPYIAIHFDKGTVLFLVEGIFDALTIYNLGFNSLAYLTHTPRATQLLPHRLKFKTAVQIPDGEVPFSERKKGLEIIRQVWPDAMGVAIPKNQDPNSMHRDNLLSILRRYRNSPILQEDYNGRE